MCHTNAMTKTLFIHAGLHKTGTTAIQNQLFDIREAARMAGCLLHSSDQESISHHDLYAAYRASGSFTGPWDQLAIDIKNFSGDRVFISSENFQSLLTDPSALTQLQTYLAKTAVSETRFVIYFREPISYIESLYLELLKHGYSQSFDTFVERATTELQVTFKGTVFHFEYSLVSGSLKENGFTLIPRSHHDLTGGSAVTDIVHVLGLEALAPSLKPNARPNTRNIAVSFRHFCQTTIPEHKMGIRLINILADFLSKQHVMTSLKNRLKIEERLRCSAQRFDDTHKTRLTQNLFRSAHREHSSGSIDIERIFNPEVSKTISATITSNKEERFPEVAQHLVRDWGW